MNDDSIFGNVLGQLGQTMKQGAKQVVKLPEEMAKDVGGQVGGAKKPEENKAQENKPQQQWQSDEERIKFLRDLYGSAQPSSETSAGKAKQNSSSSEKKPEENKTSANPLTTATENKKPSEFQEQIADKSPEEQKKLIELRNKLHKENYYEPTFNPKNPPAGGEERPAEKVEKEKKMEVLELEKKEKNKPPPLAVVRERNKAEMFRGASG